MSSPARLTGRPERPGAEVSKRLPRIQTTSDPIGQIKGIIIGRHLDHLEPSRFIRRNRGLEQRRREEKHSRRSSDLGSPLW